MSTAINMDRVTAELSAMVQIPSVNPFGQADPAAPAEEAMASYVETMLASLGMETDSQGVADGRRNVWGRLKGAGDGPTVMLAAHLDTVAVGGYDDPFSGTVRDGRVYGRGSCDMKPAFAAYFEVVRMIKASGQPLEGDLIIAGVVDEEHAMTGSAHFGRHGPKVDCAIIAEPSSLAICPQHKGQICTSLRLTGRSVHSSVPHLGVNAIYHMAALVSAFEAYAAELSARTPHPMCGTPSFSVGVVRGGENVSSVPDWCELEIDRRTVPGESYDAVMAEISGIIDSVAAGLEGFACEILPPELQVPPLGTPLDAPVVTEVMAACEAVTGRPAEVLAFTGSTDAPNFGVPSVICGAGALAQCHSLNEYVELAELEAAVQIYHDAVRRLQHAQKG